MYVIEAIGVEKTYHGGSLPVEALRGVDMVVHRGELLAIMGPSGSGKSTLLHVIAGIEPPSSGQVRLEGEDISAFTDAERTVLRRRRIGFMFQKMNLLATLTAVENVALPLRIDGVSRADAYERARTALARVGLDARLEHRPHELSGGEQQRVAVARALVSNPAVVMADEPTGALDSTNGMQVWRLLDSVVRQGHTVVVVTHDRDLARKANRIVELSDGRVVSAASA